MTASCSACFFELFPFDKKTDGSGDYECAQCGKTMKAKDIEKRFFYEGSITQFTHISHQEVVMSKPKESSIEKLRAQAEAEAAEELKAEASARKAAGEKEKIADAAKEKQFAVEDAAKAKKAAAKAKTSPAPAKKADKKAPAKKAPKVVVSEEFKAKVREKLNNAAKLDQTAKSLGVDVKKYAHLSGGLKKMSTVNSAIGAIVRGIQAGELNQTSALSKIQ